MDVHKRGRFAQHVRETVSAFLREEGIIPPGTLVSVHHAEIPEHGHVIKVYVSIFPSSEVVPIENALKSVENKTARYVRDRTVLRYHPIIRFFVSQGEDKKEEIEALLRGDQASDTSAT